MRAHDRCFAALCLLALACGSGGETSGSDTTGGDTPTSSAGPSTSNPSTSAGSTASTTTAADVTTADASSGDAESSPTSADESSSASSGTTGEEGRDYGSDRTQFFGDPRCDVPDLLLCDSFEDGALDTDVWQPNGDVSIDSAKGARGSGSLHVHAEQNGWSAVHETVTFPAPNNTYFGRMFVWIDAVPIAPDWSHWTLVGAAGSGDSSEIRVGGQFNPFAGMNLFGIGTDGGPTGDWTNLDDDPPGAPMAVVVQDWVCIEWMHDGANDETRFWWDAVEHPSLATTPDVEHGGIPDAQYVMPEFESVWVGWWLYQGGPTPDHYDVWIDEVAIDAIRIGCIY
ncbi:MAG TPA: hypothetical protein VG755_13265 [Nannocystaceae bacterium]|nr:hypothetical protein [Nannocystaceae bacterium]